MLENDLVVNIWFVWDVDVMVVMLNIVLIFIVVCKML